MEISLRNITTAGWKSFDIKNSSSTTQVKSFAGIFIDLFDQIDKQTFYCIQRFYVTCLMYDLRARNNHVAMIF